MEVRGRAGFHQPCTMNLLTPFVTAGAAVEEIHVYDKKISPCTACAVCREKFCCPINDDMQEIYPMIQQADVISISTPLYFSSVPSQLKVLIDRCQVFWEEKIISPKKFLPENRVYFSARQVLITIICFPV